MGKQVIERGPGRMQGGRTMGAVHEEGSHWRVKVHPNVLVSAPGILCAFPQCHPASLPKSHAVGINISIFQMWKVRHREIKNTCHSLTASRSRS